MILYGIITTKGVNLGWIIISVIVMMFVMVIIILIVTMICQLVMVGRVVIITSDGDSKVMIIILTVET
jgi:hypothetical protein